MCSTDRLTTTDNHKRVQRHTNYLDNGDSPYSCSRTLGINIVIRIMRMQAEEMSIKTLHTTNNELLVAYQ